MHFMPTDPQSLVAAGYDQIAGVYLERFGVSTIRKKWLERLIARLPKCRARVLDLGCGAGIPVARELTALGHVVTGVDGSRQQIKMARRNVPEATFIEADMCQVAFTPGSFDAVGAFYSITHIPTHRQERLIASIAEWLKPGGAFIASFASGEAGEWTGEWLGATMFFGHSGQEAFFRYLAQAGLEVCHSAVEQQDNEEASFLWVEAIKTTAVGRV